MMSWSLGEVTSVACHSPDEDRSKGYVQWTRPWRGGTLFYPMVNEDLCYLDTLAGLGRDEDHQGGEKHV